MSPDGATKNEIDFIMSTKKQIFNDVSVINAVKTGSDHRLVRGTLNIDVKLERSRLMRSTLRPAPVHIHNAESFQLELRNQFDCLGSSVDDLNDGLDEISVALQQLKNNKAPGDDGITAELLRAAGEPALRVLQKLYNSVILEGHTPKAWSRSVVVLFFKKGDKALLKNYRPISLLSH
ncbi:PREDICTED: uncharacterized protein LOC106118047, partial [Papilio xuthus]|uniref:Uncharacterized protein LOC106118047 n=1 Tax=Papilio xuthus TaxID=66420 RepID=A0AAJ7E9F7_PAPXU